MVVEFDFLNDLAAAVHMQSNLDHNLDNNKPNKDCFEGHTNRGSIEVVAAAVSFAVESLEGLRNDCD